MLRLGSLVDRSDLSIEENLLLPFDVIAVGKTIEVALDVRLWAVKDFLPLLPQLFLLLIFFFLLVSKTEVSFSLRHATYGLVRDNLLQVEIALKPPRLECFDWVSGCYLLVR